MYVKLRYRGMGIGAALTRKRIEHVVHRGGTEVSLLVSERNHPQIELCHRLSFVEAQRPEAQAVLDKEALTTGRRRIIMTKRL